MAGGMNGWKDGWLGWVRGWTVRWMGGCVELMDGKWVNERSNRRVDGCAGRWTEMSGWVEAQMSVTAWTGAYP